MLFTLAVYLFALISGVFGGCKGLKNNLLVLDGINVEETPGILADIESFNVPVVLAVSIMDLRTFSLVRSIAREASSRGHHVVLSSNKEDLDEEDIKREWSELMWGLPLEYSSKSLEYTLDLSPDYITSVQQLVTEKISETPSHGRIIYLNSFGSGVKGKVINLIQTYQGRGFKFVTLPACV